MKKIKIYKMWTLLNNSVISDYLERSHLVSNSSISLTIAPFPPKQRGMPRHTQLVSSNVPEIDDDDDMTNFCVEKGLRSVCKRCPPLLSESLTASSGYYRILHWLFSLPPLAGLVWLVRLLIHHQVLYTLTELTKLTIPKKP